MNRINHLTATLAGVLLAGACANPVVVSVPKNLEPAPDEALRMVARAKGVQLYECRTKAGAAEAEWAFVGPEADLFDVRGRTIGRHGAGPTWELADGSAVRATVKERADAPLYGAIPWLLLAAKPYGAEGELSKVSSIQRVNTVGGVAPTGGCDRTKVGQPVRVAYTADYVFFAR